MNRMIKEFSNILGIPDMKIVHKDIHGWLYAYKLKIYLRMNFFWDQANKI